MPHPTDRNVVRPEPVRAVALLVCAANVQGAYPSNDDLFLTMSKQTKQAGVYRVSKGLVAAQNTCASGLVGCLM